MSIRRKSTTHDLATLRLHPDGSRVQQSSVNARQRTARSTVVDSRGNWIARDAGGKSSIKKRRSLPIDDGAGGEFINLSGGEEDAEDAHRQSKAKQRAHNNQISAEQDPLQELESEQLNTRTRRRLSFMRDLSFLDSPPISVSTLEQDADCPDGFPFQDPAPDLLKAIHHFASCYYHERGQLFDSGRNYRGNKKERKEQTRNNIHTLASNALEHQDADSEAEHTESEDETTEEEQDEIETTEAQDGAREGPRSEEDNHRKDMYKAFDGSALMAMGIVLQEYVAHTLLSRSHSSEESRSPKKRRTD